MAAQHQRSISLPDAVAKAGGIEAWNKMHPQLVEEAAAFENASFGTSLEEIQRDVEVLATGSKLSAYKYMRVLFDKDMDMYYRVLLSKPTIMLPIVYTPTVGEACQKFGTMPIQERGCYVRTSDRGNIKAVLEDYAQAHCPRAPQGGYRCECIVFSDGGRILGLGDLGTWGMGIPIGKLDLYTTCAGINPRLTIPVIIDAGCYDASGNTDKLTIRDHPLYTGRKENRVTALSEESGVTINTEYYGSTGIIEEFMTAANELFGSSVLLQFEDFNSNDAFPLLEDMRHTFVSYNDDIQGTAAVAVAGILGALKLNAPSVKDLKWKLKTKKFLFHGAGSANIGTMRLLHHQAGVPKSQIFVTNSRGVIWKASDADGAEGSFRNLEQKEFAQVGQPSYDATSLVRAIKEIEPSFLVGAVGRDPGCFTKQVVEAMCAANPSERPAIFALSNPKDKAEITSTDCWKWSNGRAIYGSGTAMEPMDHNGKRFEAGQVNNVYIFPGASMGVVRCKAQTIPESFFMAAAEAVANSLSDQDVLRDRVVPEPSRIREVSLNVATAVVLQAEREGLAMNFYGESAATVRESLLKEMWVPNGMTPDDAVARKPTATETLYGSQGAGSPQWCSLAALLDTCCCKKNTQAD